MKLHIKLIFILTYFLPYQVDAQATFKKGFIITISNEKVEGSIKQSFKTNGKLIFLSSDNRKKAYAPSEVKSFSIDGINFISYSEDFYEEISTGVKANLYRKVTNNRNKKIYNGVEVVGFVRTTEGNIGDFYFLSATQPKFDLITQNNFKDYFIKLFNTNDSLISKIKDGGLEYSQIKKVMELYNN